MSDGIKDKPITIKTVDPSSVQLDRTFPYDDALIFKKVDDKNPGQWKFGYEQILDGVGFTAEHLSAYGEPPTIEDIKSRGIIEEGDQFLRLGKDGAVIRRRSLFQDPAKNPATSRLIEASEAMVRMLALCSGNSEDEKWALIKQVGPSSSGLSIYQTPWDLGTATGAKQFEQAVEYVIEAKEDGTINGKPLTALQKQFINDVDAKELPLLEQQAEVFVYAVEKFDPFATKHLVWEVALLGGMFVLPHLPNIIREWREGVGSNKRAWIKEYMQRSGVDKATATRIYEEAQASEKFARITHASRTAWIQEYMKLAGVDEIKAMDAYVDMKKGGINRSPQEMHALKEAVKAVEAEKKTKGPDDDDGPPPAGANGGSGVAQSAVSPASSNAKMVALPPELVFYANQSLANAVGTAFVNGVEIQLPPKWGHLASHSYTVAEFYSLTGATEPVNAPAQAAGDSVFAGATKVYVSAWDRWAAKAADGKETMPLSPKPHGLAGARAGAPGRVLGARGFRIPVRVPVP